MTNNSIDTFSELEVFEQLGNEATDTYLKIKYFIHMTCLLSSILTGLYLFFHLSACLFISLLSGCYLILNCNTLLHSSDECELKENILIVEESVPASFASECQTKCQEDPSCEVSGYEYSDMKMPHYINHRVLSFCFITTVFHIQ